MQVGRDFEKLHLVALIQLGFTRFPLQFVIHIWSWNWSQQAAMIPKFTLLM